jgi:hypothetical protein
MIQQINTGLEGETGGLNEISQLIFLIAKQPLPVQKLIARCIVNKIEREV